MRRDEGVCVTRRPAELTGRGVVTQSVRPLPSQLSHFSLVLGSVPVPEQTVHVWNLGAHRRTVSMIRLVIAVTSEGVS